MPTEARTIHSLRQRARRSHRRNALSKTGVLDTSKLKQRISSCLEKARKGRSELAVVLLCLDRPVTEDPTAGWNEEIDRELVARLQRLAGPQSTAGRLTDSDLCLVLPNDSVKSARELIDGLRPLLDLASASQSQSGSNRWSAGIATHPDHGETAGELLMAAEGAAQDAKLASRDRVQVALAPETREALEILLEPEAPERSTEAVAGSASSAGEESSLPEKRGGDRSHPLSGHDYSPSFRWYVTALLLGTAVLALLSATASIGVSPLLFVLVLGAVVALDLMSIDVFKRGKVSPAAVPILALAYYFGPLGPIVAEAVIAIRRAIRREPAIWWAFDFAVLSLAGGAAALVFDVTSPGEELWMIGVGAMAALAYYAVNTGLLLPGLAFTDRVTIGAAWRDQMAWLWPHYIAFGVVAAGLVLLEQKLGVFAIVLIGVPIVLLWVAEKQYVERSRAGVEQLRESHDQLERANQHLRALLSRNEELLAQMQRSMLSTIVSLARSIEARDPGTGDHTGRVAEIASDLARELGLDERELRAVRIGAVIHDIGKIGIPDGVLLKPGKLDDAEFEAMRKHPEISSYIIAELDLPPTIKQMCRNHHERYDGSGYPDRLAGEEIPLAARILAVADSFDAMTSDRPYRRALEPAAAREEIEKNAGSQFCPRVVSVLSELLDRNPGRWTGGAAPLAI